MYPLVLGANVQRRRHIICATYDFVFRLAGIQSLLMTVTFFQESIIVERTTILDNTPNIFHKIFAEDGCCHKSEMFMPSS